jgi:hypothetical protein
MNLNKLTKSFLALSLALGLSSCEALEEAANIDLDATFNRSFSFSATEPDPNSTGASFSDQATLDLGTGDVADYVDKLKNIEVTALRYTITNYNGPADAILSGSIDFGDGNIVSIEPVTAQELYNNGQETDISDQAGAFNYLKDQLLDQKALTYNVNAEISEVPANVTINLVYSLKVTASPLE